MGKSKVFKFELRNFQYNLLFIQLLYLSLVMLLLTETVYADLYKYRTLQGNDKQTGSGTEVLRLDEKYPGDINNLRGKPGQGYHIEVEIGTPKQKVGITLNTTFSTKNCRGCEFNPGSSHTFAEIDREINFTAILLPFPDSRRVVVSYKQKQEVLVNRLVKLAQEKNVVR